MTEIYKCSSNIFLLVKSKDEAYIYNRSRDSFSKPVKALNALAMMNGAEWVKVENEDSLPPRLRK